MSGYETLKFCLNKKGVLPFSKVVTFTLKTPEFSRKLSILLQFKIKFRPVTNISGEQLFNENKFDVKMTKMTIFCLIFIITDIHWKISNFPLECPTVWSPCLKNYVFFTVLLKNCSFQGKSWKPQILMKLVKNIKFPIEMPYRLVSLFEKL